MNHDYLFVYGTLRRSLRRAAKNSRNSLLNEHADFISEARFQGRMYLVDYYPGVVSSENKNDWVVGEIYALREPEIILPKLDHYEECLEEFEQPTEYIRVQQKIFLANGNTCTAWVYLYNWPVNEMKWIPSGDFSNLNFAP